LMAIYGPPFPNYRGGPLQRGRLKGTQDTKYLVFIWSAPLLSS
jgi:hypothetical protein